MYDGISEHGEIQRAFLHSGHQYELSFLFLCDLHTCSCNRMCKAVPHKAGAFDDCPFAGGSGIPQCTGNISASQLEISPRHFPSSLYAFIHTMCIIYSSTEVTCMPYEASGIMTVDSVSSGW